MMTTYSKIAAEIVQHHRPDQDILGGTGDPSSLFAAVLERDDPDVCQLIMDALPPGMNPAELLAIYRDNVYAASASGGGPQLPPGFPPKEIEYAAMCRS